MSEIRRKIETDTFNWHVFCFHTSLIFCCNTSITQSLIFPFAYQRLLSFLCLFYLSHKRCVFFAIEVKLRMQIVTGKNGLHLNAIILSQNQKQFCGGNCSFMNQNDNKNNDKKSCTYHHYTEYKYYLIPFLIRQYVIKITWNIFTCLIFKIDKR